MCPTIADPVFMLSVGCFRNFTIKIIFMQLCTKETSFLNSGNNNLSNGVLIVKINYIWTQ